MTDYRNLLKDGMWKEDGGALSAGLTRRMADAILATRVPDLCPDCEGSGETWQTYGGITVGVLPCDHPNAPTISDLLRWGENVAKARPDSTHDLVQFGRQRLPYATALLAALRTEADDE